MFSLPLFNEFSVSTIADVPPGNGVYTIFCKVNNFVYYGSAAGKGFKSRFRRHIRELNLGIHHSPILQAHWKRYGAEAFVFQILEFCPPEECLTREQVWIDGGGVGSENKSYNISARAGIAPSQLGRKQSKETARKRALIRLNNPLPPETMKRIGECVAEANSKEFVVTTPDGKEIQIKNLSAFCRTHNLIAGQMINVAKAVHRHHKNWKCRYATESEAEHLSRLSRLKRNREILVISPDGTEDIVTSLKIFCDKNHLSYAAMVAILNGHHLQTHEGWRCRWVDEPKEISDRRLALTGKNKHYVVTHPAGHEEEITGLPEFCKTHNLCPSTMTKVVKGKHLQHKGFKIRYANESPEDRLGKLSERSNNREYTITSPSGQTYHTNSLTRFGAEHGISDRILLRLSSGEKIPKPGDWSCRVSWETEEDLRIKQENWIERRRIARVNKSTET